MIDTAILAFNGKTDWRIIVKENAGDLDRLAAKELADHILLAGDVQLEILSASETERDYEISIGGARPGSGFPQSEDGAKEGFRYKIDKEKIWIEGSGSRGALYGVFAFLENELGVRWFTKDHSSVPKRCILSVRTNEIAEKPDFDFRRSMFKCSNNYEFGVRNRLNELNWKDMDYSFGSSAYPYDIGHTIHHMVPESLYEDHPEYFPLINGRREVGEHHQRCLSNPDVLNICLEEVRRVLRENPDQRTIAVSQADTFPDKPNNCQCADCLAVDEKEETSMGSFLKFVNAIADAIADEFPDVMVNTLAYRYTRKPPKHIRPSKNVMIVLCSIECCFSHPINGNCGADYMDGPIGHVSNQEFIEDLTAWSAICENIYIWDYVTNFQHYLAPHLNLRAMSQNVRYFMEHNVCGLYPEGAHDCIGADMDELRSYMLAKQMWNAGRDCQTDMREFLIGILGVAAAPIMSYIDLIHDRVEAENIHMSTYAPPDKNLFTPEIIEKSDRLFEQAERLAPNENALAYVRCMRMSLRYIKICLYDVNLPIQMRYQVATSFQEDMKACGIEKLNEGGKPDEIANRLRFLMKL